MQLSQLLQALPEFRVAGADDAQIQNIVSDSRRVQPGDLFVAYPGVAVDARKFVPDAIQRGASAIVTEGDREKLEALSGTRVPLNASNVVFVFVPDAREALAFLSAAW